MVDIHLATDKLAPLLERQLTKLSFTKDNFVGGIYGIAKQYHFSKHPITRDLFIQEWKETIELLKTTTESDFFGYAEAEIISPKRSHQFKWKSFNTSIPFPFGRLVHKECPPTKSKSFDFHITVDLSSVDARLMNILENEINFYHVDIQKPSGTLVRVYTFQPMNIEESPLLYYDILLTYLTNAGGFEGKLQLETTYDYARFPSTSSVPPIVTRMPLVIT